MIDNIPTTDNELIKLGFPPGIKIINIENGPPQFPQNTNFIDVEIDKNYLLSSEEVISRLTVWFNFISVQQYQKPISRFKEG